MPVFEPGQSDEPEPWLCSTLYGVKAPSFHVEHRGSVRRSPPRPKMSAPRSVLLTSPASAAHIPPVRSIQVSRVAPAPQPSRLGCHDLTPAGPRRVSPRVPRGTNGASKSALIRCDQATGSSMASISSAQNSANHIGAPSLPDLSTRYLGGTPRAVRISTRVPTSPTEGGFRFTLQES
jgi:hypothetical protein